VGEAENGAAGNRAPENRAASNRRAAAADGAEVVLLRHGATEWSASGRHTGRTDMPLTADGERQAKAAIRRLAGYRFGLVLSSPLIRARRTAEAVGFSGIGTDPDLQEWDYGGYEGLTTPQIREQHPGWLLWRDGVIKGSAGNGESAADVGARADRVITRIQATLSRGDDVALVSHGHFLRVFTARWLGLGPNAGAHFALDTASVSVLGFEHAERVIRHWNDTGPAARSPRQR
jgi:broad specificity phosphatase PhoE